MPPAARIADITAGPPPHISAAILPPAGTTVTADLRPRARVTDRLQCSCGLPDFIVTGSLGVQVQGLPAARVGSKTMHGGTVVTGSTDLDVGGISVGATLGFPAKWLETFNALAPGRASGKVQQTYGNCGIESSRGLIRAGGGTVNEIDALNWALAHTDTQNSANANERGGSYPDGRQQVLSHYGVPSHLEQPTAANITQAVAEGRGVITSHDAGVLWGNPAYVGSGHAITVTGIEYDADGAPKDVITNDTGLGEGSRHVGAATFFNSLWSTTPINVSDQPLKK